VVRQKSNGVEIRERAWQFELTSDDVADTDDDDDIVGAAGSAAADVDFVVLMVTRGCADTGTATPLRLNRPSELQPP